MQRHYIYIHVCVYVCVCVCVYVCMYVCMYVGLYVCMYVYMHVCMDVCMHAVAEICHGAEFGGTENIFADQDDVTFFSDKISILPAKISDDLFLVIGQVFRIFPLFSLIFRIFTLLDIVHNPFLTRKTTFFYSFHTFAHIRQHYFSKYWGDECMGHSHTSNLGDRPP